MFGWFECLLGSSRFKTAGLHTRSPTLPKWLRLPLQCRAAKALLLFWDRSWRQRYSWSFGTGVHFAWRYSRRVRSKIVKEKLLKVVCKLKNIPLSFQWYSKLSCNHLHFRYSLIWAFFALLVCQWPETFRNCSAKFSIYLFLFNFNDNETFWNHVLITVSFIT